jgi:hypothetical protein
MRVISFKYCLLISAISSFLFNTVDVTVLPEQHTKPWLLSLVFIHHYQSNTKSSYTTKHYSLT